MNVKAKIFAGLRLFFTEKRALDAKATETASAVATPRPTELR
jgi:hypothetical protein